MNNYVIGDLHGHITGYRRLLRDQGLIDPGDNWCGGTNRLWLMGDFFDRGEDGVACLALTMALQAQARAAGGRVHALLGNHELMLLCACTFGNTPITHNLSAIELWQSWGGHIDELARLTPEQVNWLRGLPAMTRVGSNLMMHADAMLYVDMGLTIQDVNARFFALMRDANIAHWLPVLRAFGEHAAFSGLARTGVQRAEQMLKLYGGEQLIHGHTPIAEVTGQSPLAVNQARHYAEGLCVNVEAGLYLGGPGFVYTLRNA